MLKATPPQWQLPCSLSLISGSFRCNRESPIAPFAAHDRLVDPDHPEGFQQPRFGDVARIQWFEPQIAQQPGCGRLGLGIVPCHEHDRAMTNDRSIGHDLGPDLIEGLDHPRARQPPRDDFATTGGVSDHQPK